MQQSFEEHVRHVFDTATTAAEIASASSKAGGPNARQSAGRGSADIVVSDVSERLRAALEKVTQITEIEKGLWVVGDFTRRATNSALYVKEAAVDAALSVFTEGIDEADGKFFAPSWVE